MKSIIRSTILSTLFCSPLMAQNSNHFYAAEWSATPKLRVFDVDTGAVVSQVNFSLANTATDLALAPNGELYACSYTVLYKVNAATGVATQIGSGLGSTSLGQAVGLEFDCSGGSLLVTKTGRIASVNLQTGVATTLLATNFQFSGDIATQGGGVFYATYQSNGISRLAKIQISGTTVTATDAGFLHATKAFWGLDFDGQGRLIATDDAQPCNFYSISNYASGTPTLTPLGDANGWGLNGNIGGICSVIASGQQTMYCPASTNSAGTQPTMVPIGIASATATSGFTLTAGNLAGQRPVALFMTNAGRASIPYGGGIFCLSQPTRAVVFLANGTAGQCNGSVSIDLNTYARGLMPGYPNPPSYLSQPGTLVQCQFVGRDAGVPLLSGALEFSICE
ncbi:MAG: hypothetical protein ACKO32_10830 [Planctomycetia bacterium]